MASVDPVTRRLIWERFEQDNPQPGPSLSDWMVERSKEWKIPETTVRRVVGEGSSVVLQAVNKHSVTVAQGIAERMGADLVLAFERLKEAMNATKKKYLTDNHGNPKLRNPQGEPTAANMISVDQPDWNIRLQAIRLTMEIYGAHAPRPAVNMHYEVGMKVDQSKTTVVNLNMTPEQVMLELSRLPDEIRNLERAYAAIAEGTPIPAGEGKTIESAPLN